MGKCWADNKKNPLDHKRFMPNLAYYYLGPLFKA
jgi:hypothetical protein